MAEESSCHRNLAAGAANNAILAGTVFSWLLVMARASLRLVCYKAAPIATRQGHAPAWTLCLRQNIVGPG
jgi:hypothetical protein